MVEVLLLSSDDELRKGVRAREFDIWVRDTQVKVVTGLIERYCGRVFIPTVIIRLLTIPWYRK